MGEGGADAAAVEVDDVLALTQREDDALIKSVGAVSVEQSNLPQQIEGITLRREMTAQTPARGITDLEFLDQDRIVETTLVEIAQCLGVMIDSERLAGWPVQLCCRRWSSSGTRRLSVSTSSPTTPFSPPEASVGG